ncbi:MAG: N-acetylmuramoyl-L-alanine amidase [Candidatus Riflebacteria bacterium]|nr:N-acetylmuramoyl-L-alanine amidase [Candidatus Riflebacteria bacterium]
MNRSLPRVAHPVLWLLALLLPWATPARAVSENLNKKTVELTVVGGVRYIPVDVFQDALALEGDQTLSGAYRLFGSAGQTADIVVEFSAGSSKVLLNDREAALKHPPIQGANGLLIPYDEFVTLFLPESANLKKEEPTQPQSQATLQDITQARLGAVTAIYFKFTTRPDYRFQFDGDTGTLQVVFRNVVKQLAVEEIEVDSDDASKITLEAIPEKSLLVASIHLRQEVTYDSAFDETTGQLALKLKAPGAVETQVADSPERQGSDMQSWCANRTIVLDAGHGGDDQGVVGATGKTEARLALELALRLKPLLEKGGFKVAMTRNSDGGMSLTDRLIAVSGRRPALVLSIHLNSSFDPEQQGAQIYVLKVPANVDPQDVYAGKWGVHGPSPEEIGLAHKAARKLMAVQARALKRRIELVEEELLLPAGRLFCPAVTLEVAYLTSPRENALLERRAFLDQWTYSVYSGLYDYFLERWKADGGSGPAMEKLPDLPDALPAPEKAAPAPAKMAASKKSTQVDPPELADALDGEDAEEATDGPDGQPATTRTRDVIPRAAAVPPPRPRPSAARSAPPADVEEESDEEVSRVIRQATPVGRQAGGARRPSPKPSPADEEPAQEAPPVRPENQE